MSPVEGTIVKPCFFCGKFTSHIIRKTVKYFEHPHDTSKGSYVHTRTLTCEHCKTVTKE